MIKRITILRWLLVGAILFFPLYANAQNFDALKWENRVLVLSADEHAAIVEEQIALLSDFYDEMEVRELLTLRLTSQVLRKVEPLSPFPFQTKILENRQERRYLEALFARDDLGEGGLSVTLVGLDGEVKERWEGVVDPQEIMDAIDVMPMRQRELREQQ